MRRSLSIALRDRRRHNHGVLVIPAWVWRGGPVFRAVSVGLPVGLFLGVLGFAESGSVAALLAALVASPVYGIPMTRRMARFWPGAKELIGADRVAVVGATRRGDNCGEARLAHAVVEYSSGLREAHEQARRYRWIVPVVVAVSLVLAVVDSFVTSTRPALVSWLWVAIVAAELWWWPRRRADLLAKAERAEALARQMLPR
jgi:hypothetical protein